MRGSVSGRLRVESDEAGRKRGGDVRGLGVGGLRLEKEMVDSDDGMSELPSSPDTAGRLACQRPNRLGIVAKLSLVVCAP